jgi:hypothetical protein
VVKAGLYLFRLEPSLDGRVLGGRREVLCFGITVRFIPLGRLGRTRLDVSRLLLVCLQCPNLSHGGGVAFDQLLHIEHRVEHRAG